MLQPLEKRLVGSRVPVVHSQPHFPQFCVSVCVSVSVSSVSCASMSDFCECVCEYIWAMRRVLAAVSQ